MKTGTLVFEPIFIFFFLFFGVTQFGYCHAVYTYASFCFWVNRSVYVILSLSYVRISNARRRPTNTQAIHLIELRMTQDSRMLACTFGRVLDKLMMRPKPEAAAERNDRREKKHPSERILYNNIIAAADLRQPCVRSS